METMGWTWQELQETPDFIVERTLEILVLKNEVRNLNADG